ncbi:hypothetical protein ACJX0J_015319, partial [Zea mays]
MYKYLVTTHNQCFLNSIGKLMTFFAHFVITKREMDKNSCCLFDQFNKLLDRYTSNINEDTKKIHKLTTIRRRGVIGSSHLNQQLDMFLGL